MAEDLVLPLAFLRECFHYDPATGVLRWRARPAHHFHEPIHAESWNIQNAGQRALTTVDADGYLRGEVRFDGRRVRLRAHRVAYRLHHGLLDAPLVDHENGITSDNRATNLRAASYAGNARNRGGERRHVLPKGVAFEGGRFVAALNRGGKRCRIGRYDTPAEAHAAYCTFAAPIHGRFFNPGPEKLSIFD